MYFEGNAAELPDFVATRDHLIEELVGFTRALRAAGVEVPVNASIVAARALVVVGFDSEARARTALRAALVSREEDLSVFDRLFPQFWERLVDGPKSTDRSPGGDEAVSDELASLDSEATAPAAPEGDANGEGEVSESLESVSSRVATDQSELADASEAESATRSVYSPAGRSAQIAVNPAAFDRADGLEPAVRQLTAAIAGLRGRRWARTGAGQIDPRGALRQSFETGGMMMELPERERKRSAVRAVFLVDVSQSVLDTIDRGFLIRFLRQVSSEWRDVRIFFFDTSVREVTEAFDADSETAAVRALNEAEAEWGGGTRIGNAVQTVRQEYPTAIDRETFAFVISDGLEVGEIAALEEGMTWLSRRADVVLWLNPLAASAEYEPTCRGMAVARPYIDGLFAMTGPGDIAEIARQLTQHGIGGNIGYAHDPRRTTVD